ncbi:2-amino-4-hydroxy-6-hydroxymethyldihydropteridine diphosphokinase [Pseudomonadota bacterium]
MARVYISVGSNIEPALNIRSAIKALRSHHPELLISTVYESEAVGFKGDNFYNFVVAFDTNDTIEQVADTLRQVEDNHARDRSGPRFSSRTIDLDLLLYNDLVCNGGGLNIPRDEIESNAFVLWPLAEIAPDLIHPVTKLSIGLMWQQFDKESQQLWPINMDWNQN